MMGKIIPFGMPFDQALRLGYTGRMECAPYLKWVRTLDCDTCGAPGPSDPSHLDQAFKGQGTKSPDLWAIPECRLCHNKYDRTATPEMADHRMARAAMYLLRAFFEGVLKT